MFYPHGPTRDSKFYDSDNTWYRYSNEERFAKFPIATTQGSHWWQLMSQMVFQLHLTAILRKTDQEKQSTGNSSVMPCENYSNTDKSSGSELTKTGELRW